jgi:hypothetical protein
MMAATSGSGETILQKLGFSTRTNPTSCFLDPTEHAGSVPTADRQPVEIQILHEVEQGDAISLAQLAFLLDPHHGFSRRKPLPHLQLGLPPTDTLPVSKTTKYPEQR